MRMLTWSTMVFLLMTVPTTGRAQLEETARRAAAVEAKVVEWRRDIHRNPELSKREVRTAALVAEHLRSLGIEVRTGVGGTGVVGLLRGAKAEPVVALRADMDALPVTEQSGLPFASTRTDTYEGEQVGVMHACGHDAHVAMLMGVAEVLAGMRATLPGSVKFIFQPAEEGEGGAAAMIADGALEDPRPGAIFGLHVMSSAHTGTIDYRPGGLMASSDRFEIAIRGRQTHGAYPWRGIDPIVVGAQIVLALQTIPSRQLDSTLAPAVVTVGIFDAGVRYNIIPEQIRLVGTIRALDPAMQKDIHERVRRTAVKIAESVEASAEVTIETNAPVTYNDPELTARMAPILARVAGADNVRVVNPTVVAEDFSEYQNVVPGMFFFLGCTPGGTPLADAAPNHSPRFFVDEAAMPLGVKALAGLAVAWLEESERQ
ncbi:MAG TPA: amidohydrolase [Thermoanaerobaculia bacterium]|nr:amidohydrolase [Thermoanaerobaculia bacterium]